MALIPSNKEQNWAKKITKMMPYWDVVLDVNTFSMSKFKSKGAELFCPLPYAHFNDYDG